MCGGHDHLTHGDIVHAVHHTLARITLAHMPARPSALMSPANDTHSESAA